MLYQALRLQRPGARTDDDQRRGRRACPPGDPPRRLRARRTGGRRLVRDDRLQQGQRDLLLRASRPPRADPARRMGLRRARHVGLVRHALDGTGRPGRPRPRDARALRLVRPHPRRRRPRRPRGRVGPRRAGASCARADGTGRDPRTVDVPGRARGGRPRPAGGGPPGGRGGDGAPRQRRAPAPRPRCRPERRGDRAERGPARHGRGQLRGDAPPASPPGRRAGRAAAWRRRHLGGGLPHRARAAPDRHAPRRGGVHGGVLRQCGTADDLVRARRGGAGAHGPDHVDRPAATGAGGGRLCGAHPRELHAGRVRCVGTRAGERRALGAAPRRRRAHRQHGPVAWSRFLRRRERAGGAHRRPRRRPHLRARRRGLAPVGVLSHPRCEDRRVAARHR